MIEINGSRHRVFLLDSNVIISCLKDRSGFGSNLLNRILPDGVIAFSAVSLWEISLDSVIFDEFFRVFSVLPSILVRSREELLIQESEAYLSGKRVGITSVGIPFSSEFFRSQGKSLRDIVDSHISKERGLNYKNEEIDNFLDVIRQKTYGFMQREQFSQDLAVRSSIEMFAFQLVAESLPDFVKANLQSGSALDIYRFPSAISMSAIYHYKFTVPKRKGEPSDLSDILISSSIPYVDSYVTENGVATSIREIRHRFGLFRDLEVLVSRDIVGNGSCA